GGLVGTGPFVVRELVLGSHLTRTANERYVLGRPKVDEIEIRFITDGNALVANILSGQIDASFGPGLTIEQGVELRNEWSAGRMEQAPANWLAIHPQMLNPTPAIVTNLQFRRALLHAIDRQQMVDALQAGLTSVAHSFLHPNQPQYREIEAGLIHYDYDPRRAEQMIADLGYTRAADGLFRDADGQRLTVEARTTNQIDIQPSGLLTVADSWQRVGVEVEQVLIPVQRQRDAEYRS